MKKSIYTIFFPVKGKDKIILYNTLSGTLYLIDDELQQCIQEDPPSLSTEMSEDFKKELILIDDEVNELQTVSVMRHEMRFKSSWWQFMIMTTYACNLSCPHCYEHNPPPIWMDPAMAPMRDEDVLKPNEYSHSSWSSISDRSILEHYEIIVIYGNKKSGLIVILEHFNINSSF